MKNMGKGWRIAFGVYFIMMGVFIILMPVITNKPLQIIVGVGGIILGSIDLVGALKKSKCDS